MPLVQNTRTAAWPSGLRRQLQALVRKGVGSNPTAVIYVHVRSRAQESAVGDTGRRYRVSILLIQGRWQELTEQLWSSGYDVSLTR